LSKIPGPIRSPGSSGESPISTPGTRSESTCASTETRRTWLVNDVSGMDHWRLAERVGFEPTVEFPLHTLSKRAPSTTRTSLPVSGIDSLQPLLEHVQPHVFSSRV